MKFSQFCGISAVRDTIGDTLFRLSGQRSEWNRRLVAGGLNVVYVSRQLGRSDPGITLRAYAHLFDRELHAEKARAAMDAVLTSADPQEGGFVLPIRAG